MIDPGTQPALMGLYAITPDCPDTARLLEGVEAVLAGGCRWLQYRDKLVDAPLRQERALALVQLCRRVGAALIINDDVALALQVGAAGVHLGQDDGDLRAARAQLGSAAILGASCYQDFSLACRAAEAGASYVAFGAVYPSPTKPTAARAPLELFARARTELAVPACAIGGITLDNAVPLVESGASLLAVISDLFQEQISGPAMTARAQAYQRLFQEK